MVAMDRTVFVIMQCLLIDSITLITGEPPEPNVDCLETYQGWEYLGHQSVTLDGLTCQAWAADTPHKNLYTQPWRFPDTSLGAAGNFCRNPNGDPEGPWCYTTDPNVKYSYCDIPMCDKSTADTPSDSSPPKECLVSPLGWEYMGRVSVTKTGRTCQAWIARVPHNHTNVKNHLFPDRTVRDASNYCRMPANSRSSSRKPWCYTTDPDVRWEECDIPVCSTPETTISIDCLETTRGWEYQGNLSVTRDGLTCQLWSSDSPHKRHYKVPFRSPDTSREEAHNYCRNPSGNPDGPWCYTTDPDVRYSICDIPLCNQSAVITLSDLPPPKECLVSPLGWEYMGRVSVTKTGRTCQEWVAQVPHSHTFDYEDRFPDRSVSDAANYCRMLGRMPSHIAFRRPWCLTMDPAVRYEECDIPMCSNDTDRTTILNSIEPLKGVRSGGTEVTFSGVNMNGADGPQIQFEGIDCPVLFGNDSIIICRTKPVDVGIIDIPLNITMMWSRFNRYLDPTHKFTYKPDPTITSITSTSSIISGGVQLPVIGEGLDAVGKPTLEITVVYQSVPVHVFSSPCTVINSTVMLCPTPEMDIVDSDGNVNISMLPSAAPSPYPPYPGRQPARKRRSPFATEKLTELHMFKLSMLSRYLHRTRRQATDTMKLTEFRINNKMVEFHIGFKLDGVQAYRNLSKTLPQYSKLTVYVDPMIERWTEDQEVRHGKNLLEVNGERLMVGIRETDYTMMIGQSSCSSLEVYNNKLVCTAPTSTPTPHKSDTMQGVFTVRVHIGEFKRPFLVGKVMYKMSFFDNPKAKWGVIGACIMAGLILCIIIAVCAARKMHDLCITQNKNRQDLMTQQHHSMEKIN